ncbi:Thiopurine S-methyltransferase [Armadillidium nasatum]|uniref:Thiopurine S-methyltransferase n=1 Tax=Armadillidium nasatum TaxID=96803 RepID=A0A5N5TPD3_9CRUS|nr:Thiopurine S-methyltransferase [Armadillidium nasatum]
MIALRAKKNKYFLIKVFEPFELQVREVFGLKFYDQGFEVVGVDFISIPAEEFFKEHNLSFKIRELPWAKVYESSDQRIKIYVADIFSVEPEEVGKFDVIWARADYTNVKMAEREKYSKLMKQLCKEKFLYFLCTLQFEVLVGRLDTPPRPLSHEETKKLYGDWCKVDLIEEEDARKFYPGFKSSGTDPISESYFILTPK